MPTVQTRLTTVDSAIANLMVAPEIAFLDAQDDGLRPMLMAALGNGLANLISADKTTTKWEDNYIRPVKANLDVTIDNSETGLDITDIFLMLVDGLIAIGDEVMLITAVNTGAGTLTVTRAYGSTSGAAHTAGDEVRILSNSPIEGADAGTSQFTTGVIKTNNVHAFQQVTQLTDLSAGVATFGRNVSVAGQIDYDFQQMGQELSEALYSSVLGSTSARYTMNGVRVQVTTNVTATVGALLFADIDTAVEQCLAGGGMPTVMYVSPTLKGQMAVWSGDRIRTSIVDLSRANLAGGSLDQFISAHGISLQILADRAVPYGDAIICDPSQITCGWVPVLENNVPQFPGAPAMVGLRVERLARTGPADKIQTLGYASCQFLREIAAAKLTGITSVDADGV